MEFCDHHLDHMRKLSQACSEAAVLKNRIENTERQLGDITETIFGLGGSETIKSRLQRAEDAVSGLKEMVLENRELVSEKLDSMNKGMMKMLVILISIATVVIGGMFGVLWSEIKSVEIAQVEVQR